MVKWWLSFWFQYCISKKLLNCFPADVISVVWEVQEDDAFVVVVVVVIVATVVVVSSDAFVVGRVEDGFEVVGGVASSSQS